MKLHLLETTQRLPVPPERIWNFLTSPENLKTITPPEMKFRITSPPYSGKIFSGQIITYKVFVLRGMRVTWVTEITHMAEHQYFIDEQRMGPYAFWHHRHQLTPIDEGVEMKDVVHYRLPFGFVGDIFLEHMIRRQLVRIFSYRYQALEKLFGAV